VSVSEKQRRLRALERILPFFRLCADAELVGVVLEETADIPRAARRGPRREHPPRDPQGTRLTDLSPRLQSGACRLRAPSSTAAFAPSRRTTVAAMRRRSRGGIRTAPDAPRTATFRGTSSRRSRRRSGAEWSSESPTSGSARTRRGPRPRTRARRSSSAPTVAGSPASARTRGPRSAGRNGRGFVKASIRSPTRSNSRDRTEPATAGQSRRRAAEDPADGFDASAHRRAT
jgi:hypothetical protein